MVDLPQHAAQVSIWTHFGDPRWGFERQFFLDFGSPYLFGYAVARLLASWMDVVLALKVTVILAVLALPFSLRRLFRRTGADEWWSLIGFPLAFGVVFYWGFLNFLASVPIFVLFLVEARDYAEAPSRAGAVRMALFAAGLYLCHALVLLFGAASAGLMIAEAAPGLRAAARRVIPVAVPALLALAWGELASAHNALAQHEIQWELGLQRLGRLPSLLFDFRSAPFDPRLPRDYAPFLLTGALVVALGVAGARLDRRVRAWGPAALAGALYLALPHMLRSVAYIYHRFAAMIVVCLLAALAATATGWRRHLSHGILLGCALGWLGALAVRFHDYDADARDFDAVRAVMQPLRSVAPLTFDLASPSFPELPVFLHFVAWYQAESGGSIGYSFAKGFMQPARYLPGAEPVMTPGLEWEPRRFNWRVDGHFDYFLVHAGQDLGRYIFAQATSPVALEAHRGRWWLYRRLGPAAASAR